MLAQVVESWRARLVQLARHRGAPKADSPDRPTRRRQHPSDGVASPATLG
ncbi:MAG: hypothetical protein ACRDTF_13060 [Pseudonocardiaceae bacterium]